MFKPIATPIAIDFVKTGRFIIGNTYRTPCADRLVAVVFVDSRPRNLTNAYGAEIVVCASGCSQDSNQHQQERIARPARPWLDLDQHDLLFLRVGTLFFGAIT